MKSFIKSTLATVTGLLIFSFIGMFFLGGIIGAVAALGKTEPAIPAEGILEIDMSTFYLGEQDKEVDAITTIKSGEQAPATLGLLKAVNAVRTAATDPGVKFIYLKADNVAGGTAHIEEFRAALQNFRESGKAIISYVETPTNAGYYLASVADKMLTVFA